MQQRTVPSTLKSSEPAQNNNRPPVQRSLCMDAASAIMLITVQLSHTLCWRSFELKWSIPPAQSGNINSFPNEQTYSTDWYHQAAPSHKVYFNKSCGLNNPPKPRAIEIFISMWPEKHTNQTNQSKSSTNIIMQISWVTGCPVHCNVQWEEGGALVMADFGDWDHNFIILCLNY